MKTGGITDTVQRVCNLAAKVHDWDPEGRWLVPFGGPGVATIIQMQPVGPLNKTLNPTLLQGGGGGVSPA